MRYHLSTPNRKTEVVLSMYLMCWDELVRYGASEVMQREYGAFITETEAEYSFTLTLDLENLPPTPGALPLRRLG